MVQDKQKTKNKEENIKPRAFSIFMLIAGTFGYIVGECSGNEVLQIMGFIGVAIGYFANRFDVLDKKIDKIKQ